MKHTIQYENFTAKISSLGAELKSFKNELTGFEYVWYGFPEIWGGSAPALFPIVGRLKDDEYEFEGKTYQMNQHGFARKSEFKLTEKSLLSINFSLKSSKETLKIYPFNFNLEIDFKINKSRLQITNTVTNTDTKSIFFNLGFHPAFNLPLENSKLEDYYIEFDKKEDLKLFMISNGLIKTIPSTFTLSAKNRILLSPEIFNNDALIFKNINSREISIGNTKTDYKLKLTNTGNAPHLGLWAKPGAPYVCIEPWHGHADMVDSDKNFIKKDNIIELSAGESFSSSYEIEV